MNEGAISGKAERWRGGRATMCSLLLPLHNIMCTYVSTMYTQGKGEALGMRLVKRSCSLGAEFPHIDISSLCSGDLLQLLYMYIHVAVGVYVVCMRTVTMLRSAFRWCTCYYPVLCMWKAIGFVCHLPKCISP